MAGASTSEWGVRMGPITRNNCATKRDQAEEGARQMVMSAAKDMMDAIASMGPGLLEGVASPAGCSEPELSKEAPEVQLVSYELPNGSWFTVGTSNEFGLKVVCKKLADG